MINDQSFNRKIKKFKKKTWLLACHENEIINKNDFKTLDYFDEPVIIYNLNNEYFAFKNVCAHRGSKIKAKKYGNEVFNCIYHGWAYNKNGNLISGPKINEAFNKKSLNKVSLLKMKLEMCGSFIFITDPENKQNLNEYLLDHFNSILSLSKNFGTLISSKKYQWNCNWKVAIENSIDEYHGPILHKGTFSKVLDLKPSYSFSKKVSEMNMPLLKSYIDNFSKILKDNHKRQFDKKYRHFYIFPISTIASTMGLFCYLQRYIPVNKNNSIIETDIFIPNQNFTKKQFPKKLLIDAAKKFNDIVFLEDQEICESITNNQNLGFKFSILGKYENRINFFRKLLNKY